MFDFLNITNTKAIGFIKLKKGNIMKRLFVGMVVGFVFLVYAVLAPAKEPNLKFAVISDVREDTLDTALAFISSQHVEFILLPGDFCFDGQEYYPYFIKHGFGVSKDKAPDQQRLYMALGNHDYPPSGETIFQNNIAPYYPDNGPPASPRGTVFSFDQKNCHFVMTNPYWNDPKGGYTIDQLDWIQQDLADSSQPFKFVIGHEPAFPQKRHVGDSLDSDPAMRDRFWEILSKTGAQIFFCGHSHNLSHLLYKGVYQMDAGEVRSNHLCVTIVEVGADKAVVSSYKTDGQMPEPGDWVCRTIVDPSENIETNQIDYLYGAAPSEGNSGSGGGGCFISSIEDEKLFH